MKSIVACLLVLVVSVHSQWLNNFGYGLNPAGYFGGYYPVNGFHTGFPAGAFYGHPGRFVNYPVASLPSYDAIGNQVGGYGQVQDTPEVAQAKAAHFAAHAAARARLMAPVAAVPVAEVVATPVVETVAAAAPAESIAVAATPVSRNKRQIQHLTPANASPFAYGFTSPLAYNHYAGSPFAYNNFGTFGYNYGAPFGHHFDNPFPYNGHYYPTAYNFAAVAPVVVSSPVAGTKNVADAAATVAKTA